jgi:hypothetical protein
VTRDAQFPGRSGAFVTFVFRARRVDVNLHMDRLRERDRSISIRSVEPMKGCDEILKTEVRCLEKGARQEDVERGDGVDDVGGGRSS